MQKKKLRAHGERAETEKESWRLNVFSGIFIPSAFLLI